MHTRMRAAPKRKLPDDLHNIFAQIKILATSIQYQIEAFPAVHKLSLLDLLRLHQHHETRETLTLAEWACKSSEYKYVLDWLYLKAERNPIEKEFLLHWAIACKKGHFSINNRINKDGFDPTALHPSGMTALDIAVLGRDKDRLEYLVELSADNPNIRSALAKALFLAAQTGEAALAKILVNAGADLSYQDEAGNTALHIAIASSDAALSSTICSAISDIDINDLNDDAETAAHVLARVDSTETAVSLLSALKLSEQNLYLNLKNCLHETPFTIAAKNGHTNLIRLWLKENNDNQNPMQLSQWNLHNGLVAAARCNHATIVNLIAPYVASRIPALKVAIQQMHDDSALAIIPHINIKEQFNEQADGILCLAANSGRSEVVKTMCVTRLNKYIEERTVQQVHDNGAEHKHTLFGKGLGQPAFRKIAAATVLREYILGNKTLDSLSEYSKELNSGSLGKLKVMVEKFTLNGQEAPQTQSVLANQANAALRSGIYLQ